MFLYGLVGPLQGPIARALNGVDLSWAAGLLATGALYYTLCRLGVAARRVAVADQLAPAVPAIAETPTDAGVR
jgi:hypothetical protein